MEIGLISHPRARTENANRQGVEIRLGGLTSAKMFDTSTWNGRDVVCYLWNSLSAQSTALSAQFENNGSNTVCGHIDFRSIRLWQSASWHPFNFNHSANTTRAHIILFHWRRLVLIFFCKEIKCHLQVDVTVRVKVNWFLVNSNLPIGSVEQHGDAARLLPPSISFHHFFLRSCFLPLLSFLFLTQVTAFVLWHALFVAHGKNRCSRACIRMLTPSQQVCEPKRRKKVETAREQFSWVQNVRGVKRLVFCSVGCFPFFLCTGAQPTHAIRHRIEKIQFLTRLLSTKHSKPFLSINVESKLWKRK